MNMARNKSGKSNRLLIPIVITMGFIPLIVHMYQYDVGWEALDWFPSNSNAQTDFFLGWKAICVMAIAVIMTVMLLYHFRNGRDKLRTEPAFALLLIYGVFVLMSSIFSPYKPQVFTGSYEVIQPLGVLLGYLIICFYSYQFVRDEKSLLFILRFSGIGLCILLVIGFFQLVGFDLFHTTFGKYLIADPSWWNRLEQINFTMPRHVVYATLYNPDFLSFYFGIVFPVLLALFFAVEKLFPKIIIIVLGIMSIICIIGAGAASGYLAIIIAVVAGGFILLSRNKRRWRIGMIAVGIIMTASVFLCMFSSLGEKIEQLFLGTQSSIETRAIKSIETKDDGVYFDINGRTLAISYIFDNDTQSVVVFFADEDGNFLPTEIVMTGDSYEYELSDSYYGPCQVEPIYIEDVLSIRINLDGYDWYFTNQTDGTYYYYNPVGKYEKVSPIEKSTLFRDDAFSGRGNLWNLIIPQLPKHIFIGSGANSFARIFPQNDYVYKVYQGLDSVFAVKAHNWFLQEWIENGLIGALCLFGFYFWYAIRSIQIYRRCDMRGFVAQIGFGIFVGTIGYMAAGVANDSNVCTAPVFWVMMGLGMAINRMIVEKEELFVTSCKDEVMDIIPAENESTTISSGAVKTSPATSTKGTKKKSRKQRKQERK